MTAQVCKGRRGRKNLTKTLKPLPGAVISDKGLSLCVVIRGSLGDSTAKGAMALLHRRKAFSAISRYRLCGRYYFSCLSSVSASSSAALTGLSSRSSYLTQIQSLRQLFPEMALASSLIRSPRSYTTVATCLGSKHTTPCCYTHKCAPDCGCACTITGALRTLSRNCTTTAYPPPAAPKEYQDGGVEVEADGAPLNMDEAEAAGPMEGAEDFNMPPYDDSNIPEDEDYEDEDPPPDPEEKLLFSPSDED
ncbi:hypothetical protein L7F22_040407 [Adiantum nelumboides]|nr:hypothetical protein [Adiantum nelumboides]